MLEIPLIVLLVIALALLFDYTNGFHDTANAIATVVATRVLSPRNAIIMAVVFNFLGALLTTYVAKTIAAGLIETNKTTELVVLAAIIGAITWNLITWWLTLPSSSSHALIGGLLGAAFAHAGNKALQWTNIWFKVLLPMVFAPITGFIAGLLVMSSIYFTCSKARTHPISPLFKGLQVFAAAFKALSHGQSDAQKSMGIITISLVTAGLHQGNEVPLWVILSCATAIALGTAAGGWRIINTMGNKIVHLEPVHGFASDSSAATIIFTTSMMGMPISTTQIVASSIFGVGTAKGAQKVRWIVGQRILIAWILTLPAAALISALAYWFLNILQIF
jgi:PiT family inorganic phosphate transporter